jgi:hypothetical protein
MSCVWWEVPGQGWKQAPVTGGAVPEGCPAADIAFAPNPEGSAVLLTRAPAWVNGQPVLGGVKALEHQDEILVGQALLYFSAEATPTPVVFRPEPGQCGPRCPLCRDLLNDGDQAVRCPRCGHWYHQIDPTDGRPGRPCWTTRETCWFCRHPTALSGEPGWRPEQEESHAD